MSMPPQTPLQPGTLRPNELPEWPLRGPFLGIDGEPYDDDAVFKDLLNVILWYESIETRPGYTALTAMPTTVEAINGISDFFTSLGTRVQTIITPTRLLKWDGSGAGSWTVITGALTGAVTDLFSATVVNHKLLFCQGINRVQLWDGVTAGFADASANAVPARYLMELSKHLVVADTIEGGNRQHQRIRWTGAGDPTDWISFSAGSNDLLNSFGPINGLARIYQTGYAFQQRGITQIIPTGRGDVPFNFVELGSDGKGLIAPYSLATYGETIACYVGKDNIYMFNGTESIPIGDRPIAGSNSRVGARARIMAELLQANLSLVTGYISTSINGNVFNAYWLNIPTGSTWVYNIDEGNWTRWQYNRAPRTLNRFTRAGGIRIIDLVGRILDQTWTFATLGSTNPLDGALVGFADGTPGYVDFTTVSESDWSILSAPRVMGDRRHSKTVKKFRLVYVDFGPVTFSITLTSDTGQTQTKDVTVGTGTGRVMTKVIEFSIPGWSITYEIAGDGGQSEVATFVELTPIYDVGGEIRG